jgi:hypothetical protein
MLVEVSIDIRAPKASVWAKMTELENAAAFISGIDKIEILEQPASGLVGLKWRETRMLFGKPATADKSITEAVEGEFYKTRAESDGFIFLSTMRLSNSSDGVTLTSVHDSQPQSFGAKVMSVPMGLLFKGVAKKALRQDLIDIKLAAESAMVG